MDPLAEPGTYITNVAGIVTEQMARRGGHFPPFGLGLKPDGKVETVFITEELGDEQLCLKVVARLKEDVSAGKLVGAVAVAACQEFENVHGHSGQAICIQVHERGAKPQAMARFFRKRFLLGLKFKSDPVPLDELFAEPIFLE